MPLEEDVSSESSTESSDEQVCSGFCGGINKIKIQFVSKPNQHFNGDKCAHIRAKFNINKGQFTLSNL